MENKQDELKIMPRGAAPRSVRRGKNMIAVASGKGGVGKTWFSITLAHALSGYKQKTLLFDGDLGLANVDIQLGLMVKDDLGSVIAGSSARAAATPVPGTMPACSAAASPSTTRPAPVP